MNLISEIEGRAHVAHIIDQVVEAIQKVVNLNDRGGVYFRLARVGSHLGVLSPSTIQFNGAGVLPSLYFLWQGLFPCMPKNQRRLLVLPEAVCEGISLRIALCHRAHSAPYGI